MKLVIIICFFLIFATGLTMVFNTSSAEVLDKSLSCSTHYALFRQITYACISGFIAYLVWKIGIFEAIRISPVLFAINILALCLVFVPGIGVCRKGAHRWLNFAGLHIQPSEFIKYIMPLFYIEKITSFPEYKESFKKFLILASSLLISVILVMLEPDNGTALVLLATMVVLFIISEVPLKFWMWPLLVSLIIGSVTAYNLPYVRGRIAVYLNPGLDLKGKGHQPHQAKIAAGSGRIFGKGPGNSLQKLTYLPEAKNDYIAAIYAEEFGFIGILVLTSFYATLAYGSFVVSLNSATIKGAYLAAIIAFIVAFQVFLNLGVVSGLLPSKGVNLPFFSQGGSSLIANFCGLALLLKIGQHEQKNYNSSRRNRRAPLSRTRNSTTVKRKGI
ncbi:putative lipid II flippase FtsW [Candidatus Clavichlamydia salmonicola]|uniref:peptidoglycan glycosyltransferase FtsW n=1 Tax=Candidatus Clavichlamydia salmonicola TaxID=469812 RepID=UPI00189124D1|nr:putative peptidoglycan glycosyltransferase FtsW [Candidatus Clavichlamydia salmonicola]MBF5050497.1 putative lipid II flippase FtsW [Candidatus Clavichlamydia salmonicola]